MLTRDNTVKESKLLYSYIKLNQT